MVTGSVSPRAKCSSEIEPGSVLDLCPDVLDLCPDGLDLCPDFK